MSRVRLVIRQPSLRSTGLGDHHHALYSYVSFPEFAMAEPRKSMNPAKLSEIICLCYEYGSQLQPAASLPLVRSTISSTNQTEAG